MNVAMFLLVVLRRIFGKVMNELCWITLGKTMGCIVFALLENVGDVLQLPYSIMV
jgi:hypothetical protein